MYKLYIYKFTSAPITYVVNKKNVKAKPKSHNENQHDDSKN